nr:MAG TPA: YopX protein [Caudoviricetes sp.]
MIPKYRAWDRETKSMNGMAEIYRNRNQEIELHPRDENIILMQSTGLRDKNGKEIFEGDVLEIQGIKMIVKLGSYNYIETSKSGNHTLGVMCDCLGFYVECLNVAAPDKISPFEPETLKTGEIIGNIYENPELLEVSS